MTDEKVRRRRAGTEKPVAVVPVEEQRTRLGVVAAICREIMLGGKVRDACSSQRISRDTLASWLTEDAELGEMYSRARAEQANHYADEALEIADSPATTTEEVQRNRLRVDTRKWLASKLAPRLYGDRVQQDVTVHIDRAEEIKNARQRAAADE